MMETVGSDEPGSPAVDVQEMLQLQLAEYEMLQSMFPDGRQLRIDDPASILNIKAFVDRKISYEYLTSRLGFTVDIAPETSKVKIELVCQLPHEYPAVAPVVFTRAPNMTRLAHQSLNEQLHAYIVSLERGEICLYSVIEWIQENLDQFETTSQDPGSDKTARMKLEEDSLFVRLWIYSHHIYSKFKRRDIIDWANELKLSGFSLPGKPGVVCVEGYSRQVDDYWHRLRRLNWKKLAIKEKEEKDIGDECIDKYRKFGGFEEQVFDVRGGKGREYHMDLGMLSDFLKQHDSGHIFQMYFGVEGKHAS